MSTQVLPEIHAASRPRALARIAPYLTTSLLIAAAWLLYHAISPAPKFPLDDPYITLHSAQVLHWGQDPNYPGVSPLYGATSAPFLGLIYILLFYLAPIRALEFACWLGILAYVLGLVYLTRALYLSKFQSFAIVILGLTSSFIPVHLLNGLETSWAFAAVVWTLSLGSSRRPFLSALAAGLSGAIRPDLVPFTVAVLAALTCMQPRGSRISFFIRAGALAFIPISLCSFWYFIQTGHPYPLTGITKRYYEAYANAATPLKLTTEGSMLVVFLMSCGPLLLGLKRIARQPLAIVILFTAGITLLSLYIQFPDELGGNRYRYSVVFAPMLVWALAVQCTEMPRSRRLLTVALLYSVAITLPFALRDYFTDCYEYDTAVHQAAEWCNQNLPPDARILVEDAGYIGYATKFRIIDVAGLKTPEAIELNRQYTWPSAGGDRAQAMVALALMHHGDYLINLRAHAGLKPVPARMAALGWKVEPLKQVHLYSIYRLRPPDSDHTQLSPAQP